MNRSPTDPEPTSADQHSAAGPAYGTLVEESPALLVALDARGTIVAVNAAVEAATGFSRDELCGRAFGAALLVAASSDAWRRPPEGEAAVRTRSGAPRTIDWRARCADSGVWHVVGLDVTDARALERRARDAEQRVAAAELTGGLAHEIRNPLNAARLELEVLTRRLARAGDADGTTSAAAIRAEIDRLERLLSEFLDLSYVGPGPASVGDLAPPVRAALRLVADEARRRTIDLDADFAEISTPVKIDSQRIRRVVINLVRNALEAIGERGRIIVRLRDHASGGVELSVEDDGPGIAGEPSRIFRAFHTTKPTGTGLGLTVAQRIAHEHGAELTVQSRRGCTIFSLVLPAATPLASIPPRR